MLLSFLAVGGCRRQENSVTGNARKLAMLINAVISRGGLCHPGAYQPAHVIALVGDPTTGITKSSIPIAQSTELIFF